MVEELTGGCLCGADRYSVRRRLLFQPYACHCTQCQTRSGSAFGLQLPVMAGELTVEGDTIEGTFTLPSGTVATVVASPACLTRLYTRSDRRPQIVNLRAGTLDDSANLVPGFHLWTSSKQPWVVISDDVPTLATEPADMAEWQRLLLGQDLPVPKPRSS